MRYDELTEEATCCECGRCESESRAPFNYGPKGDEPGMCIECIAAELKEHERTERAYSCSTEAQNDVNYDDRGL